MTKKVAISSKVPISWHTPKAIVALGGVPVLVAVPLA
jgi:hypothetical protein